MALKALPIVNDCTGDLLCFAGGHARTMLQGMVEAYPMPIDGLSERRFSRKVLPDLAPDMIRFKDKLPGGLRGALGPYRGIALGQPSP